MKEIVIEIPDEVKEMIDNYKDIELIDMSYLIYAVRNGTELPKGHTELIDTRILIQGFCMAEGAMKSNGVAPVFDVHEITNLILAQDVLVEADKGDTE